MYLPKGTWRVVAFANKYCRFGGQLDNGGLGGMVLDRAEKNADP